MPHEMKTRCKKQEARFFLLLTSCFFLSLSIATYQRNLVWRDGIKLWEDTVKKSQNAARPHFNLASSYKGTGQIQKAIREYKTAVTIRPWFVDAHNNLGDIYYNIGQVDDAIFEYKTAIRIKPDF